MSRVSELSAWVASMMFSADRWRRRVESWEEERGPEDEDEDEGMPRRVERAWRWVWRTGWRSERERVLLAASGGGV